MLPSRLVNRHLLNGNPPPACTRTNLIESRATESRTNYTRNPQPLPSLDHRIHPCQRSRLHHRFSTKEPSHQSPFGNLQTPNHLVSKYLTSYHRSSCIGRYKPPSHVIGLTLGLGVYVFGAA